MKGLRKFGTASLRERFAEIPGVKELTPLEVDLLFAACQEVRFAAGTEIMKEGDLGDSLYFFLSGEVDVTKALTLAVGHQGFRQGEKSFVKLVAGTVGIFGEMSVLEDAPRAATITASSDCVLYELKQEAFSRLCAEDPRLGVKLLQSIAVTLSRRVRKGNDEVLKLSTALSIALTRAP